MTTSHKIQYSTIKKHLNVKLLQSSASIHPITLFQDQQLSKAQFRIAAIGAAAIQERKIIVQTRSILMKYLAFINQTNIKIKF